MDKTEEGTLKKWRLVKSESGPDLPLFKAELKWMANPRNEEVLKAIVLHASDTVNIIAVTNDLDWLLVEQYRFGIDELLLELPAGLIDAGEIPIEAAKRELLEETGYQSDKWELLGVSFLNPAYVTNRCFHFLALDCNYKGGGKQDVLEDLRLHRLGVTELTDIIDSESIVDAVGSAALRYLRQYLKK